MGKLVTPKVYFVGCTEVRWQELLRYLKDSGNEDFENSFLEAMREGLSATECLVSFYAKLCYASLTLGHNANVSRVRDIPDNLRATHDQGHGSVWEHCWLNFVVTNCSRVFTHELIRHRVGTGYEEGQEVALRYYEQNMAFSQTSGRYVRGDEINIVFDPILEPVRKRLADLQRIIEDHYNGMVQDMGLNDMKDFNLKKKITSALRRILPNGQSNEIGFSMNLRAVRHLVMLRTSRHAEWEIRLVFGQIYGLLKEKFPLLFHGAREEEVGGLVEVTGMKTQPY